VLPEEAADPDAPDLAAPPEAEDSSLPQPARYSGAELKSSAAVQRRRCLFMVYGVIQEGR